MVRVFDKDINPGLDAWTYGYHPEGQRQIPMGSGAPSRGYVEMWGGTSKTFPNERHPLAPGASIEWTEWMAPFHLTGGLTTADREFALRFVREAAAAGRDRAGIGAGREGRAELTICPAHEFEDLRLRLLTGDRVVWETRAAMTPDRPFSALIDGLGKVARPLTLTIEAGGRLLLKKGLDSVPD